MKRINIYAISSVLATIILMSCLGCYNYNTSKNKTVKITKSKLSTYIFKHYSYRGKLISSKAYKLKNFTMDKDCTFGYEKIFERATVVMCGGLRIIEKQ